MSIVRLPAIPLIANDPYFSYWCPGDRLTDADTCHWCGEAKPIRGLLTIDGQPHRFLGLGDAPAMQTLRQEVTPTATECVLSAAGVELALRFTGAALPDDLDVLSAPITMVDFALRAVDGKAHECALTLSFSAALCAFGEEPRDMHAISYSLGGKNVAFLGQLTQKPLSHSGDHTTIDWGYLYLMSAAPLRCSQEGLSLCWNGSVAEEAAKIRALVAYDDIASINYFGSLRKAWCFRDGSTIVDWLRIFDARWAEIQQKCRALDKKVLDEAESIGGADYALIAAAAWRHTFAAHKLIADEAGHMVLLSKENDSNGCIGTVDISYPSAPIFLKYCPQLVNALCRGVLKFAEMPVWEEDYAPHDIGRYPYATGQVYAACDRSVFRQSAAVYPPYYLYPAGADAYNPHDQMPVEECGNMLIMLYAALRATGDASLIQAHRATLAKWAKYLCEYGEDPGEQLCTDDFAGHLAHNVNLAAKALVGVACYARLVATLGEDASAWERETARLRDSFLARAQKPGGGPLTFDGVGWSMKYNLVWDEILGLNLLPREYYAEEVGSYAARMNRYGLPLDSRKTYTKSDWELWVATMAQSKEEFCRFIAPVAAYLRETPSRVPFSDWYDTVTGKYEHFIARAVQGGLYMPMLKHWK